MIAQSYVNKIINVLSGSVKFAFIFGSATTKYFNSKSDIDIAVWLENVPVTVEEVIDLKYQVEKSINFEYDIDLIILNNSDIIIANQVITTGQIIIDNEPEFTNRYILSRRSMYFDFKFFRKPLEDNLKTKIL